MTKEIYIVTDHIHEPEHYFPIGTEVERIRRAHGYSGKACVYKAIGGVTSIHGMKTQIINDSDVTLREDKTVDFKVKADPESRREVKVVRERLLIEHIRVGESFTLHSAPTVVYVKISNSHVFNHTALQMHTTEARRFKDNHLNLVTTELRVFNGK